MCPAPLSLGALRTRRLIGRTREREAIRAAIEAEGELRILYIIGNGGIGKTRLLDAIPEEILPMCPNKDRYQWSGIFDLYHVDIHTNSGIEAAIIKALDPKGFTRYRARRREYEKLRRAGGDPGRLEELREELGSLFVQGFNEIAAQTRVILCFDAVELVQYESDVVQEVCGLEYLGVAVRGWLMAIVPQLKNAVVIFSGRPQKQELWRDLQEKFTETLGQPLRLHELTEASSEQVKGAKHIESVLSGLSAEEVRQYFADLAGQNPRIEQAALTEDDCEYIHQVTEGKPLRVAFVSTLIATKGYPPQKLLEDLKPETIDESLIWEIRRLTEDVNVALPFVAWTRKGMDSRLLQRLLEDVAGKKWGINKCGRLLNYLKDLPFVKSRPRSPLVFLHDEMYGLMDKYVLSLDEYALVKERVCQIADEYYEGKIDKAKGRKRQDLMVVRLYYQLLANPMRGFNTYRTLSDEAIIAHEVGFDLSLRDEQLRFFEQRGPRAAQEQIARDSAVRWVKRFLAMEGHEKAREVAKRIWEHDRPPFQRTEDDPYFTAALQVYWNEASLYLAESKGAIEKAAKLMREAIEPLEAAAPADEYQRRNQPHLLGRAYNDLGYAHTRLRDYNEAVAEYSRAIRWLKRSRFWGEVGNTEKNLAYVYAMLGRWKDAANLCEESLKRFRELEMRWGEAWTLNVYGLVEVEDDNPHRARKRCRDAIDIFTDLDDQRGIGLTSIALGRALRKMGSQDTYLFSEEADEILRGAESRLQGALAIFPEVIDEPVREVEPLAELGRIYRDWAYIYRRRGEAADPQVEELEQKAEGNLQKAAEKARQLELLAEETDAYADLAALYFNGQAYDKALEWVTKAETRLPQECVLAPERHPPLSQCPLPQYFLILGKCSLLRGNIAWERGQQKEKAAEEEREDAIRERLKEEAADSYQQAVEWWIIAFGYFELYSPTATTLSLSAKQIYRKLVTLWPAQLETLQKHCYHVEETYGLGETTLHREFPELIMAAILLRGEGSDENDQ